MGRFDKLLLGKGKDVMIGDEKFNIKPLSSGYMGLLGEGDKKQQTENLFEIVRVSLAQTDPTITLDDVKSLPLNIFNDLVETILDVNELNKE